MLNGADDACNHSTGLTQEIDIMDIGSSTPKRKCTPSTKSKSPLKGVLKIRLFTKQYIYIYIKKVVNSNNY